jgi:tRNA nucleotidyltransferase (CCA-adding enzyme)
VGFCKSRTAAWDIPTFVRSILSRLHRAGHEAYVVGGAVRDLCMDRPATDWDVTTSAGSDQIVSAFKSLRSFSLKHETVTLVQKGRHYEVTTFRGPDQTLEGDLEHRDFTINAMAYDMRRSVVIDPWGGRKDIAKGVVRGVVSPEERFREDPLRLMRAVRIATELGFRIEGKTLKAISSMAEAVTAAAPERIRDEMIRILLCQKPSQGLRLLGATGLFDWILPELVKTGRGKGRVLDRVAPDPALRLAALFCRMDQRVSLDQEAKAEEVTKRIMGRLRFSKTLIRQVTKLVEEERVLAGYQPSWSDGDLRRFIRRVGVEHLEPLVALRRAHLTSLPRVGQKPLGLLNEMHARTRGLIKRPLVRGPQDLAINGSEVMKVTGLSPGPEVGRILARLSEQLMDHPKWNTRKKLLEMAKKAKSSTSAEHPERVGERHGTASRLKARAQPKS